MDVPFLGRIMNGFGIRDVLYIVGAATTLAFTYGALVSDVDANTMHRLNTDVHMPMNEKIKAFPTRQEHDDLERNMDKMAKQIDDIHKYLLENK